MKIDKDTFQSRLSHFISTWRNDKRQSNDALFGGVGSIVILMGKSEENPSFHKNNAMHVCGAPRNHLGQKLIGLHLVLATWLRISYNPHGIHLGSALRCDHREERYRTGYMFGKLG